MTDASPKEAVVAYFDALDRAAWGEAIALIDPVHVTAYREQRLAHIIAWLAYRKLRPKASGYSSSGSVSPETIAKHAHELVLPYGPGVTVGSLAALPPPAFMQNDLEIGRRVGTAAAFGHVERDAVMRGDRARRRILGELPYNYDHAYVAYVRTPDDDSALDNPWFLPHLESMPVRRRGARWYIGASMATQMMGPHLPSLEDDPS